MIHDRDCTIAALRWAMSSILPRFTPPESAWESACNDEALLIANRLVPLLSSPNPGAKVAAVLEAAKAKIAADDLVNSKRPHTDEWVQALIVVKDADEKFEEAVRALDKREESDANKR